MVCFREKQDYKDEILSAPPITNRHIWMYLVNSLGTLTYEQLGRIVDEYKKDTSASAYDLCKAAGIPCDKIKKDVILHTIRFDYRKADNVFDWALRDLHMLCGVAELGHQMNYSKEDKTIKEAFLSRQDFQNPLSNVFVLKEIWNSRLSPKEIHELRVYAAPSLGGQMSIE